MADEITAMTVITEGLEIVADYTWLERANRKARRGKRFRGEVLSFAEDLDSNLLAIGDELQEDRFKFGPYRRCWVFVPKRRIVMALPYRSRVVQWAAYLLLNKYYDKRFIEDSFACRDNKGALKAARRAQYWLRLAKNKPGDWYVVKIDVSKYFYRIDHEVLKQILERGVKDARLRQLLWEIIDGSGEKFGLPRFASPEDVPAEQWLDDVGMPIGNLTSQLFANIYLNEVDQYCKHTLKIHFYARYMDDIFIVVKGKDRANECKDLCVEFLRSVLHLDDNRKTSVQPATVPVEFVGYKITAKNLKLRKQTVARIKRVFREVCRRHFAGEMDEEGFARRVASYRGLMEHAENKGLRARLNEIYVKEREKANMSNLRMVEALCELAELQSKIIKAQALRLAEIGAACMTDEIAEADKRFRELIGTQE